MVRWMAVAVLVGAVGCRGKDDEGADGDDTSGAGDGADGADGADGTDTAPDTGGGFPADPSPLTLTVSGALSQTLVFDQPTCSNPTGSSNLRVFWRGSGHVFVLKVELLGTFTGVGSYTSSAHGARASLQEEAGGSGYYFVAGPSDTIEMDIAGYDREALQAWGSFSVSGMADTSGGTITLSPQPIPIWCPTFN